MPEIAEVVETVERELKRFGGDVKSLRDDLGRQHEALKARVDAIGDSADETTKALKEDVLRKNEAVEKQTQTLQTTVGTLQEQLETLQVAIKRPGVGTGEAGAKRHTELLHWKTTVLSAQDNLRYDTDVAAKADLAELEQYESIYRLALRKPNGLLSHEQQKALSVGIDRDGGFLVTPQVSARTIQIVRETSPIRQLATVETISTDKLEIPRDIDDLTFGWVGEQESRPPTTTPEIGIVNIPVHEMYAEPSATQKFLDDASINVEAWLAQKVGDRFARAEANAFMTGNGINKPRGILSYPTALTDDLTRAWGTFQHILSGDATKLTVASILTLPFMLKEGYAANARWMMNRLGVMSMMGIVGSDGRPIWQPSLQEGVPTMLAGYPVTTAADMPVPGAGAKAAMFGDFGRTYTVVDRLGITGMRDPYTAKPFVKFYSRRRVGGDVTNFETMKFIVIGT